jgi:ankyrin repeat protein
MQRIENQEPDHKSIAFKTLAWVSYAFRSLYLKELQHALAIEPGDTDLDEELVMDGQNITALCAGLVIVDQRSNVVNLVHYTAKKYFENIRHIRFPGFHANITMSCATYLTLGALKDAAISEIVRNYPLAYYAAQYMGDHARQNPEEALEPSILEVICQLLSHSEKRKPLLSLLDGLDLIKSGFYSQDDAEIEASSPVKTAMPSTGALRVSYTNYTKQCGKASLNKSTHTAEDEGDPWETEVKVSRSPEVTALHLAASMGLAKVASMLLKETPNIDALDETGKTALTVAIERGFEKAVEFLVNSGARVDLRDYHGREVLLFVTERGWHNVAEIIAQKAKLTASTDTSSASRDQVQLLLATYYGDSIEAQRLVQQGNIDWKDEGRSVGATALFLAVERNDSQMVHILLAAGVDVDSGDSMGQTSLHRATRLENEALVKLLLKKGAEVDYKDDEGRTAWSANARSGNERILKILIDAGADPCTTGLNKVSELYSAAAGGETDYVKFLLRSGANPSIRTRYKWAPLHWAAYEGHVECVKLLIEAGAELSPISDQDSTPLDLALRANQIATIDLLIQAGAKERRDIPEQCLNLEEPLETPKIEGTSADICSAPLPAEADDSNLQAKSTLTFDQPLEQSLHFGQYIYPTTVKRNKSHYFQISHLLNTPASSISIRHSERSANMSEYPLGPNHFNSKDVLFDIVRVTPDYQEIELRGREQSSLYPGKIRMRKGWTGGWKIHHDHNGTESLLLQTTTDWSKMKDNESRWTSKDGKLLARTGGGRPPVLCFEHGLESWIQDILVTCWVAKIWSDIVTLQKAESGNNPHP